MAKPRQGIKENLKQWRSRRKRLAQAWSRRLGCRVIWHKGSLVYGDMPKVMTHREPNGRIHTEQHYKRVVGVEQVHKPPKAA